MDTTSTSSAAPKAKPLGRPFVGRIDVSAYSDRWHQDLVEGRSLLTALEQGDKATQNVLDALNALWLIIDRASNEAGLLRNVHPDATVRAQAESAEQAFSKLVTDIGLSAPIFAAIKAVDAAGADAPTAYLIERTLRDFRRAGVDKDAATQTRVRALREELVEIGQAFDKNIRDDVRRITVPASALAGLPADYVAAHPQDAQGQVTLTTDYPDYLPFMTYAQDDAARKALYTAFRQRGYPGNEPMLGRMLERRHELANLLGYPTWADFITEDKMIGSAAKAQSFIDQIDALARHRAEGDYQELLAAKKKSEPSATEVMDWQKTFLEEQVKRDSYAFDSQALRQYLPFGRVRDGILGTTAKMFGVTFTKVEGSVWHEGVVAYEMADKDGLIGRFYLDLHPRPNKYKHAAAFPLRSGVSGVQVPEAALVCNFPEGEDALLEHNDVETFFHEFGHLLHHLFAGKQKWVGLSGIATEWDFVEAPSQMLEEWSFDGPTLKSFAQNSKGEAIGDDLIAALRKARGLGRGLWVRQQMFYAATSLSYHQLPPQDPALANTDLMMQKLQARYSPFAFVPDTHFQLSFGHLEGYSAIYYTYMWSLVIAKDLFTPFEAAPSLTDAAVADRYRRTVLAPGGSKPAAALVADFLGRPSSFDAFGKWVNAAD